MERPKPVTVFGILCILFGAMGLLGILFSLSTYFGDSTPHDPVNEIIRRSSAFMTYGKISMVVGLFACGALLAIGTGLLKLKPWARPAAIGYAIYGFVSAAAGAVLTTACIYWPLLRGIRHLGSTEKIVVYVTLGGGAFGFLLSFVFPALLLYFMTRPSIVRAFAANKPSAGLPPAA